MNNNAKNGVKKAFVLIFTGIILAILTWGGTNLIIVKGDVRVLTTKVETLTKRIDEKTVNRYKGSDAREDFARVNEHIKDMELRLRSLEKGR